MASTQISMTQAAGTSTKKFTVSMWFKPGAISTNRGLWGCGTGTGDGVSMVRKSANEVALETWDGSSNPKLATSRKFRDPAAWYHLVFSIDTTDADSAERLKIWINGVEETSFATDVTITLDSDIPGWSGSGDTMKIGNRVLDGDAFFEGEMSHVHVIDGTIYGASTFGETDSTSGIWKIKTSPTVTYGTNGGFYKFESGALTTDSSGEGNTLTQVGSPTETKDSPSNNFCTMNPLDNYYFDAAFSNGNNTVVTTSPSNETYGTSTLGLQAGLWYFEVKCASDTSNDNQNIGITNQPSQASDDYYLGRAAGEYSYGANTGNWFTAASGTAYGDSYGPPDIIGVYVDLTASKLYFAKNGVVQNSGTGISITAVGSSTQGVYFPAASYQESGASATFEFNFGNGYFGTTAVTSAVADEGGIGAFEYDPSAGTFDSASKDFRAICTKNIKAYGG